MNKKTLLLVTMATGFSLASSITLGEAGLIPGANDPSKADLKVLTENRSLISTKIDPSKMQAEGYVAGIDEGSLDLNDLRLFIAQLRGEINSALGRNHSEETQFKMVAATTVAPPVKTTIIRAKKKNRRAPSKPYQQKI